MKSKSKLIRIQNSKKKEGDFEEELEREYPNGIVSSDVVLIDGLEPTDIVMRVRDQMDVDFSIDDPLRGIVFYELGLGSTK